jgi:effector-binding domain-containing protein
MKALKRILIALGIILALMLVIAAFLPSAYNVERSVIIKTKSSVIISQIVDLRKWDCWSPWKDQDSAATYKYNDTVGTGGWMEWNGKVVGHGRLSIEKTDGEKSIAYTLRFFEPMDNKATGSFLLAESDSGTKVTWTIGGDVPYPIGRIMFLFMDMDKMMGGDFEKGLARLKTCSEASGKYTYEVKEKNVESQIIATIHKKIGLGKIGQTLGECYGEIMTFMQKSGLTQTGPTMAITLAFDSLNWDFEAAIPVDKEIKGSGPIEVKKSYSGRAVYVVYQGPYEKTMQAYMDLDNYMKENKLEQIGGPWECYITDPGKEPDSSKWITEIYFPVKGK